MKRKIYLETSVISLLAPERACLRQAISRAPTSSGIGVANSIWCHRNLWSLNAMREMPKLRASGLALCQRYHSSISLPVASNLRRVAAGIVPAKASEDAMHISIATVHFVDYLLTWNRRHIANPEIQVIIAEYFQQMFLPFICTPDEFFGGNDN